LAVLWGAVRALLLAWAGAAPPKGEAVWAKAGAATRSESAPMAPNSLRRMNLSVAARMAARPS
jgi:hypothetical protein